ncbi:uncharacterized protein LTR77_010300 [Saxophila tyrrhenica]|uniref:Enoyl-CoA hydratase n=1 Tax=Saxophila tyrrhenica TaxID=1690608 RepID=A0AAV9NVS7_9PEZI|nr:hypothetical protein LTR77_010300 [Saxophila tyrrhenica]
MAQPKFELPIPQAKYCIVSFPASNVLLVTLNRAKDLNCVNMDGHRELDALWSWMDAEPGLACGILTGSGRAFSAGADLKGEYLSVCLRSTMLTRLFAEWNNTNQTGQKRAHPPGGFCALSRRSGRKPVIAAVNGICYGGGCEAIINADMVVAAKKATFALPEVKIGVAAQAGALPRLIRTVGKPRAMEMALTGRTISAAEAREWGLVNKVVGDGDGEVVNAAVEYAKMIAANSPDAVIVTRESIKLGWEAVGAEDGTRMSNEIWGPRLQAGDNLKEGIASFVEKRKPQWKPSKL